jgi:osmotically-inducible protein OsmY
MTRHGRFSRLAMLLIALIFAAAACQSVLVETGKKVFENRSTSDQIADTRLAGGIATDLTLKDKSLLLDVSTDVWEQRVLLSGVLSRMQEEIAVMVRADPRVRALYDEIQIVSQEEQEKRRKEAEEKGQGEPKKEGFGQTVNDFWIETKISARLLTEPEVRSVNYRWRAVRNSVYLIGRVRSETELECALAICTSIDGSWQ